MMPYRDPVPGGRRRVRNMGHGKDIVSEASRIGMVPCQLDGRNGMVAVSGESRIAPMPSSVL